MPSLTAVQAVFVAAVVLLFALSIEALANAPSTNPAPCTNCVVGTIPTGSGTGSAGSDIAYDSANGQLFVSSSDLGSWGVTVINGSTDTVVRTISEGGRPIGLAYDARNGDVYVANFVGNNVTVINGTSDDVVGSVALPPEPFYIGPTDVVYDPFNGYLDVVESNPPALLILDGSTNRVVANLNFSVDQDALATNPANGEIYAAPGGVPELNFHLDVLNGSTGAMLSSIVLNGTAYSNAYDTGNGQVYVVASTFDFNQYYNGTVTELNGAATRIEGGWGVGQSALGIAYDNSNANLYVTNYYSANVSILNATSRVVSGSVSTEGNPGPIVYDAMNRCLYVDHIEALVSILDPPGGRCPAVPVAALNGPLVLSAGGFVGLVTSVAAYTHRRQY